MSNIDTAKEREKLAALEGHTPGPWEAHGLTVYDTCMDGVASCHADADARLIAAAPDLLASTHRLLDALNRRDAEIERLRAMMRSAHAVMQECGWQLAPDADYDGFGILEIAASEVESEFRAALNPEGET